MDHYTEPPLKEPIPNPTDEAPWCAIGQTRMTDGKGNWFVGTGALFAGQLVLTAAHVVHGKTSGSITFAAKPGDSTNGKRTAPITGVAIPEAYAQGTQWGWDIAVAVLAASYEPGPKFQFDPKGQGDYRAQALTQVRHARAGGAIWLGGYPAEKVSLAPTEHPEVKVGWMYGTSGLPTDYNLSVNQLTYEFDTRGGESGSPLFYPGLRYQVIAVHTNFDVVHGKLVGQGTLLTDAVVTWIGRAIEALKQKPKGYLVVR